MRHLTHAVLWLSVVLPWASQGNTNSLPANNLALTELEQQINRTKQDIYNSKARVFELKQALLTGDIAGSKAVIDFTNKAEGIFTLDRLDCTLDGQHSKAIQSAGAKRPVREARIFDSSLPSGKHTLLCKLTYRGSSKKLLKMFAYHQDETIELEHTQVFEVDYGKTTAIQIIALDRGRFQSNMKDRLYLDIRVVTDWDKD